MTNATGFLLRTSLSDNGSMPRSGTFTGCPDIIPGGTNAISSSALIASYGNYTDQPLTQGLTNYLYIRAKNMNATPLTQVAYLFQVDGSLVLSPNLWYTAQHLVGFDAKNPDWKGHDTPDDPKIIQTYAQQLSAQPGQVVVTNAYTWTPDNTNHHCLVAVVADDWAGVLANYPKGVSSMDALAQWIYNNPSLGWHNVNIQPLTTTIYESKIPYAHSSDIDEQITFTIIAQNVPVGARVSFSSNTSTQSGQVIGQEWTPVSVPAGGGTVNPDFEVGMTITVNAGYTTIITYRTDFQGLTAPANFKMHMKATKAITPQTQNAALVKDSLFASFHRAYSANAVFHDADGKHVGTGLEGYRAMLGRSLCEDNGDDGDLSDSVVVVLGSHTTTAVVS